MASSKCKGCQKTLYSNDPSWSVEGSKWHKGCFKCSECKVTLVLRNAQVLKGVIYCEKHKPTDKPTQTADRADLNVIRAAPKIDTVNTNVRGELAGQKSQETTDSIHVGGAMAAGKLAKEARNVNDNVRGELAGQKSQETVDSIHVGGRLASGKLASQVNKVNYNIRGADAGQQSNEMAKGIVGGKADE